MRIRQEKIVFAVALLLLGWMTWGSLGGGDASSRRGPRARQAPAFEHHPAPAVSVALPPAGRDPSQLERGLFEPPRDTRPLPPLEPVLPPYGPLASLLPPPAAGPQPARFGDMLRTDQEPELQPGLFDEPEIVEEGADLAGGDDVGGDPGRLAGIGYVGGANVDVKRRDGGAPADDLALTPEERQARIESFKRQYDWIRTNDLRFGQIRNRDRFRLAARPKEPIQWIEFDPETGLERYAGMGVVSRPRDQIEEYGFAQTVANEIELRRIELIDSLSPGRYSQVLAFADWCVTQRLEAPRALEVAEEMYGLAKPFAEDDPSPDLGLARCYEAGFRFEDAFAIYDRLMQSGRQDHPVVLARLGELEARFRMFARAEEHLAEAERFGRSSWEVQWAYGRFLLSRGRPAEALPHLRSANRYEPSTPEYKAVRAAIRADVGEALVATGALKEAETWFTKSLQADADFERARAGLTSVGYLAAVRAGAAASAADAAAAASEQEVLDGAGFDLLYARGLAEMAAERWSAAKELFQLAAEADPLRAYMPWRALAWMAARTGYPEEALRFVELAHENDPTDVYTLLERGRVLAGRDDVAGAMSAYTAALDRELALPDALAAMGEIALREGDHEDSERYFERAVSLDASVAAVHALRGLNLLELQRVPDAEESFQEALRIDRGNAPARNGLAWCAYLQGDPTEAATLFRELEDSLRALPEEHPERVYARTQIERIVDHAEKVIWTDRFERQELRNGWKIEEPGPTVALSDGAVRIRGDFRTQGRARLKRPYNAGDFVSFQAKVSVGAGSRVRVGAFVSLEQFRRGEPEVMAEVSLSRHPEGAPQVRFARRGERDLPYEDVPVIEWPTDRPVTLRIERTGESSDTRFRLEVDGIPVAEDVPVPTLGRTTGELQVGIFVEGEPGRSCSVSVDDVEVIRRERQ